MPTNTDELQGAGHMEYKCVGIAGFKSIDTDDEKGVVETYVSLTGLRDNVKDIIEPGAYEKSLIVRTPKGVWHHDWKESVSKTLAIKELLPGDSSLPKELPNGDPWPKEAGALFVKTQFNLNTQRGREAYEDVKFFGEQQEWSIGYNVPVGGSTTDQKTGVRHIHTLDLYEYSPVLFGAMPSTHTASVKSAQLAYKALQIEDDEFDGAANAENDEEFEMVILESAEAVEDVESKEWGFLNEDGYFVKASNLVLSGPQAAKLTRAAYALIELLRDASPEADEEPDEEPIEEASEDEVTDEDDTETKGDVTLVELIEEHFGTERKELLTAAESFDTAWEESDGAAMEEAANPIATAIEDAVTDDDVDADEFADIAQYLTTAFDDVNEDAEEESEVKEDAEEEKSAVEGEIETKTVVFDPASLYISLD